MRYTDKKKKKPSKTSLKRERDKEQAEADAAWNEYYAQLIEYGMEHDSYQVPREYSVHTDDGRDLHLGQWLRAQGQKLNMYSRTNPQWYSDILDLVETGKLWFDNESKSSSPTNFQLLPIPSAPKASSSSSQPPQANANTSISSTQKTNNKAPRAGESRDYAMNSSSDEDSDNSMVQHARHERSPSPPIPSIPKVPEIPSVPRASRTSSRSPTAASTAASTNKKTKDMAPIVNKTAASPEVGYKRKGPSPAAVQLPQRAAKARASARSAYKDASDSGESETWQNDFENDISDNDGSLGAEGVEEGEEEEDAEEEVLAKPAARKPSAGNGSRGHMPEPTVAKPTPVFSSTVKDGKSAFAAAINQARQEKEQRAAKAAADTKAARKALQEQKHAFDASYKSVQPMQTPLKAKSATPNEIERSRVSAALSASASASASQRKSQPVPPTIPVVTSQAKTAAPAHSTLLEPPVMAPSATGLMRPEQCMSSALGGAMPPRRTMSRPKPVLAPVPTPPPMPVLSPRTPAASKDSLKTAPPPPPTKAAQTVPTAPSGSLPHAEVFHSAELPAPSTTEVTFAQKVRQLRLEKEAAAAAHRSSSPRSDVSIAGSDLPPNALTATPKTGPAFPGPRGAYSGVDVKKRSSISEAKQAAVRAAEAESASASASAQDASLEDDEKRSPRSTGTASSSSGSSPPPMLAAEALETPEESHARKKKGDRRGEETEEDEDEDEDEDDEASMVIVGGRRGRVPTPRRLDDFDSLVSSQQSLLPEVAIDGHRAEDASAGPMEVTDDGTTTATAAATRPSAGASEAGRERAHSVLTINSDTTAGNNNGATGETNGHGTDVDASSSDEEEDEDDDGDGEGERGSMPTPPGPPIHAIHAISAASDHRAPQYYLQLSEPSEDESSSTGSDVEEVPHRAGGDSNSNGTAAAPNAEFVAFAYTRSSSGPQCPMLGFGMVCNPDGDTRDSLYLIVMVPEDAKHPVTSEFRMDPDEFITVQRQLVLARDLTFVDGGRGGVFDEFSQTKIRNVLNAYPNLQIDSHFL